jgi:hypothetical protein
MAQPKSSAERMRRLRDRNKCGTVFVSGIEVKRVGVELLVAKGWLDANAEPDARQVRAALVKMVNKVLSEPEPPPKPSPGRFKQAFQTVKALHFGFF